MGVSARRRCENLFNVCMKEPANSSNVDSVRQYLQVYSDSRLKININTFRIYLLLFFVQVHSRGSKVRTSDVIYTLHICCHCYTMLLTVCKVRGDEESQSPLCALYLL